MAGPPLPNGVSTSLTCRSGQLAKTQIMPGARPDAAIGSAFSRLAAAIVSIIDANKPASICTSPAV